MIWKHVCCTSKRADFSAFRIFHLKVLMDPGKKKSHWNQSKWRLRESRKIRLGSSETSRRCRHCGRRARKGPAPGFSPVPEHPRLLDPRPLPARTPGWGGSLGDSTSYSRAWGGNRDLLTFRQGRLEGTLGPQPTLTHTPLRPRPPSTEAGPSLTVSPGSGLGALGEKGKLTLGLRTAEGRCTRT